MPAGPQAASSAGRLIGAALGHWARHQRSFWPLAGVCIAGVAILKIVALSGVGSSGFSAVIAVTYIFVLDQWFKQFLFDDRRPRAGIAYPPWSFIGFCLGYCLLVAFAAVVLFLFLAPGLFDGKLTENVALMSAVSEAIAMVAGALTFGAFLLFLPASIANLPWNVGEAFREAPGMRARLLELALFCTLVSLIGPALLVGLGALRPAGWMLLACQVLAILIDMIALYVLAYGVTRIFLARTGWQPEALPASR